MQTQTNFGVCKSGRQSIHKFWEDYAKQHPEELAGGRASPKSLYLTPPKPRDESKKKTLSKECKWLWFEEASEFENWQWKGDKA